MMWSTTAILLLLTFTAVVSAKGKPKFEYNEVDQEVREDTTVDRSTHSTHVPTQLKDDDNNGRATQHVPNNEQTKEKDFSIVDNGGKTNRQLNVVDQATSQPVENVKSVESDDNQDSHSLEQDDPANGVQSVKSNDNQDSHNLEQDDPANGVKSVESDDNQDSQSLENDSPANEVYTRGIKLISSLEYETKLSGYTLLQEAATAGNTKAQAEVAYGYLFGNALNRNFSKAFELFSHLADKGLPEGQQGLGFMYSNGIGVNSSQAKAMLYYTFAALGGNPLARMSMAYRTRHGVSTPSSCESSLTYYYKVAEEVVSQVSVFTGGQAVQKARLMDSEDGGSPVVFGGVSEDEVEHYREVFADTGAHVQLSLGLYYMFGLGGTERNLAQALYFLKRSVTGDPGTAYALIGRIYAEGSADISQSNETAIKYFKKAIQHNSIEGHIGLGLMYFMGMGFEKNYEQAMKHFDKAAKKGSPEAQYYIGLAYLNGLGKPRNVKNAVASFKLSAQSGHVLAIYKMAEVNAKGLVGMRNCEQAVELMKAVSERGRWSRLLREAFRTYHAGDVETSLLMYLLLGDIGYEIAQSNAAYILEEEGSQLLGWNETMKRSFVLWSRSATQGYSMARVKLGDFYYYGFGTDVDTKTAADQYRLASDHMGSPQAMFNLGYMYEQGIGLQQDFDLAKRYYDKAAETSSDAAFPVSLAILKLNIVRQYITIVQYFSDILWSPTAESPSTDTLDQHEQSEMQQEASTGDNWDIYLTTILCVLLVVVIRWRRR